MKSHVKQQLSDMKVSVSLHAVYIGHSSTNASKLQSVLNAAARLIGGIPKLSHISSFIRNSLDWLPIRQLIQFKSCSLARNCLTGSAPQYLKVYCIPVLSILVGPPFSLRLWVTWLSLGHERLRLNLEVLLLWAHPAGTSYLSPLIDTFSPIILSSDQFCKHVKTSDLDRERL